MHALTVTQMGAIKVSYFLRVALAMLILIGVKSPTGARASDFGPTVNYLSADAVYVNVGSAAGLTIGSRIHVVRDTHVIAELEVMHVSSNSASCQVMSQSEALRVGDAIFFDRSAQLMVEPEQPCVQTKRQRNPKREHKKHAVRGHISFQNQWNRDMGVSELSSVQPGVNARLSFDDILGSGGTLRIRHYTRLYHRSQALSTEPDTDEWSHRLSEFGIYFPAFGDPDALAFGRIINPHMRGLGYLDGGYVTLRVHPRFRLGLAGGMDPRLEDSSLQPNQQKYSVFVTYEAGSFTTRRLASTMALSGSYKGGTIDREFGYVQNMLSFGQRLSIYHSMEVEVNRGWRKTADKNSVSFSNTYLTTNVTLSRWLKVDMSYDARRNIRDYRTHDSPDSLFDDVLTTGYSGGASFSMPGNVRFRARAGVRRRENDDYTNRFGSLSLHVRSFPRRRHNVMARLSVSETPYVTGYHSLLMYRFPIMRRTRVNLGGGAYIYKQVFDTTTSTYGEMGVHQTFGRRYYLSGSFRRLTGGNLGSMQLLTEVGFSF
jgi:hypothetical protein